LYTGAPLPRLHDTLDGLPKRLTERRWVYGGVASGRMVLLGDAGAGKTSAALQLVLRALNHRRSLDPDDRARTPVPVMLGLHDWNPGQLDFLSWATSQVVDAYPFLRSADLGPGVVREMLAAGRVSFVLDSLDAVPPRLRPAVLQKLNALTAQRLVLLSRGDEMGDAAARRGLLTGAATLELMPATAAQAAEYLASFPGTPTTTWQRLLKLLRGESRDGFIKALQNPLMLSLVADLYGHEDRLGELLNSRRRRSRKAAEEYLLDTILLNAYGQDPDTDGPLPPYTVDQARRWLGRLACRLDVTDGRDVAWWRFSRGLPAFIQFVMTFVVSGLIGVIVSGLFLVTGAGANTPIASGIVFGLLIGMPAGLLLHQGGYLMFGSTSGEPRMWAFNRLRSLVAPSAVLGWVTLAGGEFALIRLRLTYFPEPGVEAPSPIHTLVVSVALSLALMIVYAGTRPAGTDRSTTDPWTCWKRDLGCGLLIGAVLGLGGLLAISAGVPSARGIAFNLAFGLGFGVTASRVWQALLVFVWLRVQGDGPLRMMHFLEDARKRHVLRTVGPRYQFRHARLQDRLAMQASRE
ncbi:NACHT domain-containing protein, partial [Micromonospora sp. DT44]|uniref:NACHT domain-containing protein n=1 Tax=Micromonospora sp. DT44 TaxID=3393439 RepID=UPI003CF893F1